GEHHAPPRPRVPAPAAGDGGPHLGAPGARPAGRVGRDLRAGLDGRAAHAPRCQRPGAGLSQREGQIWATYPYLPWLRDRGRLRITNCGLRIVPINPQLLFLPVVRCWWPVSGILLPPTTPPTSDAGRMITDCRLSTCRIPRQPPTSRLQSDAGR